MRKIHRNNSLLPALIIAVLLFTNCNKKLDETLYDSTTAGSFYKNADQVTAAYLQPYAYIQTHIYQVHFQDVEFTTDEACVPALYGYIDQQGQWIRFHKHTWTNKDFWILLEWQDLFQAIGYCNNFIDNIQTVDITNYGLSISKEQMIAEIKMVRALHYYWALSEFGNVPIIEHVGKIGDTGPSNNTPKEVFAFIEKDIKDNIQYLSEKGDDGSYGHFTKGAAYALLAKLYLNAESMIGEAHWQDCINACNNVKGYTLDAHWNDPFLVDNESSNENIYVVPFDASRAQQFNFIEQNIHENIINYKYCEGNSIDYGWRKISTQESFYDLFKPDDVRIRQWLVGLQTYTDEDGNEQPVPSYESDFGSDPPYIDPLDISPEIDDLLNADDKQGVMNMKYQIEYGYGNYGSDGFVNMNNDMVVFRFADILYMKAECLMRLNGDVATEEALGLIDQVRRKRFSTANYTKEKYTTATLTMDELLNERGREFAYEMFRREDLIRFGKFEDAWWEKDKDADKHTEIFPIPFDIITSNPNLKQNPGY